MQQSLPVCYTEFLTTDQSKWRNIEEPPRDKWFDEQLKIVGGQTIEGKDRLRRVWGAREEFYYEATSPNDPPTGWYKKYFLCFVQSLKHWKYTKGGKTHILPEGYKVAPVGVIVTPVYEIRSIGKPRWIVEILDETEDEYRHLATMQKVEKGVDEEGRECQISSYVAPGQAQADYIRQLFNNHYRSQKEKVAEVNQAIIDHKLSKADLTEERIRMRTEQIYDDLRENNITFEDLEKLPQMRRMTAKEILGRLN